MARLGLSEGPRASRQLRMLFAILGLSQLLLGLFMALAPGAFFDSIATYGTRNDHYIRDVATVYLALGVAFLIAVGRPSWRVPVLDVALLQYAFHSVNHLIDIGDSDPGWIGPFNFVALVLTALLFAFVLRHTAEDPA
jgi:Domain of unknown function (DUF4345)